MDFLLRLLEISLTSVWSFLGALILLLVAGGLIVLFVGQIVLTIVDRRDRADERLEGMFTEMLSREGLDDAVYRASQRGRRRSLPY